MERERTLVNLEQESITHDANLEELEAEIHTELKAKLSKAVTEKVFDTIRQFCAQSGKLGAADVQGMGSLALLWDAMQRSEIIAVGKYTFFFEMFKELELPELSGMVKESDDRIIQLREEEEARHRTPERQETCSSCRYEDEENITAAEFKCTKCEKNNLLCGACAAVHGPGLGHTDFIFRLRPEAKGGEKEKEIPVENLMDFPQEYQPHRVFDKAAFLLELAFPARPRCHFAYGVAVSRDMGIWRHLVLARCLGELGGPAETLMAFSFDGKCVYINSKDIANDSCHVVPRGEKEYAILRQEEPHIRITDTAAKRITRDVYIQAELKRVWTVDTCGQVIYILHGEGKLHHTSLLAADMTGKVRATLPTGKQGFVVCDKRRPRVVILSNKTIGVYDWKNERLQEVKSGEHGLTKFDIWDICSRDEILLAGLSTIGEAPWEVMVYQMNLDNSATWSLRRIQLMRDGEKTTIKSFCSPKISFCQNRLMLGYKFPIEAYRVEVFELTVDENKKQTWD